VFGKTQAASTLLGLSIIDPHQSKVCLCLVPDLGQATGCMATKVPLSGAADLQI